MNFLNGNATKSQAIVILKEDAFITIKNTTIKN